MTSAPPPAPFPLSGGDDSATARRAVAFFAYVVDFFFFLPAAGRAEAPRPAMRRTEADSVPAVFFLIAMSQ
jgi:hypothetical protein